MNKSDMVITTNYKYHTIILSIGDNMKNINPVFENKDHAKIVAAKVHVGSTMPTGKISWSAFVLFLAEEYRVKNMSEMED